MQTTPLLNDPARAWAAFEPSPSDPWDRARVAHLHRRAGFAASWAVLERDREAGPEASIDRLLEGEGQALDGQPAADFEGLADAMATRLGTGGLARLQGAWLYRMIFTGHPLRERLTLFWHGHFATSDAKVNNPALMQRQNDLLRRHALGDFRGLLAGMARDPAMLLYLDSASNRKAHPNENYAREVMELFTLGRGHYGEKDIQEAARAFTGFFVQGDRFKDVKAQHDDGPKTVLGRTGNWTGDDVARILLDQPACAEFLCTKLFALLVSELDSPSPALIAPLAEALRGADYDIAAPVALILRSRLFHEPAMRRRRVKSPVELAVGTVRALEVLKPTVSAEALAEACGRMGQAVFAPPNVAGWDGGPAWVNTTTMLARTNFALALLAPDDAAFGKRLDPAALAGRHGAGDAEGAARFYLDLLVQEGVDGKVRDKVVAAAKSAGDLAGAARAAAGLVLAAPEYQLA